MREQRARISSWAKPVIGWEQLLGCEWVVCGSLLPEFCPSSQGWSSLRHSLNASPNQWRVLTLLIWNWWTSPFHQMRSLLVPKIVLLNYSQSWNWWNGPLRWLEQLLYSPSRSFLKVGGLNWRVPCPLIFTVLVKTVQTRLEWQQYNSDGIVQEIPKLKDF